jgi:hypothetical protein
MNASSEGNLPGVCFECWVAEGQWRPTKCGKGDEGFKGHKGDKGDKGGKGGQGSQGGQGGKGEGKQGKAKGNVEAQAQSQAKLREQFRRLVKKTWKTRTKSAASRENRAKNYYATRALCACMHEGESKRTIRKKLQARGLHTWTCRPEAASS